MLFPDAGAALRFAAEASARPESFLRRWKARTGRRAAGLLPIFAPEEVPHAAGMLPVTLWGTGRPSPQGTAPAFLCPLARSVLDAVRSGRWNDVDAWIVPSTCDTLQNACEVLGPAGEGPPLFPLVFPVSGEPEGAAEYLLDRIEALVAWTERVSGRTISGGSLERSLGIYDRNRDHFGRLERRMAESPGYLSATEFLAVAMSGMVLPKELHTEVLHSILENKKCIKPKIQAKLFISGILLPEPVARVVEESGAALVGNDLAAGHRYYERIPPEPVDPALAIVRRHLARRGCPTLHHPGGSRIPALLARAQDAGADRILVVRMSRCEPEGGDLPELEAESRARGFPLLVLESESSPADPAGARTRIGAFVEMEGGPRA